MIVLVGASASGKTELAKLLFKKYGYVKCITTTTRNPRLGEKDGIDYHFLSKQSFLELKDQNAFLEVSLYNQNYYGMQKKDVVEKGVVVVDPNGANSIVRNSMKEVFIVYVETSEATRIERMRNRRDQEELIQKRITNDHDVFIKSKLLRIDLVITNENENIEVLALKINDNYLKYLDSIK